MYQDNLPRETKDLQDFFNNLNQRETSNVEKIVDYKRRAYKFLNYF